MKNLIVLCLLITGSANAADFFTSEGSGQAINQSEEVARASAVKAAKDDARMDANNACFSRRGVGLLCSQFNVEVSTVWNGDDSFLAHATATGMFKCGKRDEICE